MAAQLTDWLQSDLGISLQKPGGKDEGETTVEEAFSTGYKFGQVLRSLGTIDQDELNELEDKRSSAARMRNFRKLKGILYHELGISLTEEQSIDVMTEQRGAALRLLLQLKMASGTQTAAHTKGSTKSTKGTIKSSDKLQETQNILFPKKISRETLNRLCTPSAAQYQADRYAKLMRATSGQILSEEDVMERAMLKEKTMNQTLMELRLLPFENHHRKLVAGADQQERNASEEFTGKTMVHRTKDIEKQGLRRTWMESHERDRYASWKQSWNDIRRHERDLVDLELRLAQSKLEKRETQKLMETRQADDEVNEFNETLRRLGLNIKASDGGGSSGPDLEVFQRHAGQGGKTNLFGNPEHVGKESLSRKDDFHVVSKDTAFGGFSCDNLYSTLATPLPNDLLRHVFAQKYESKEVQEAEADETDRDRREETPFEFYDRMDALVKDNLSASETKVSLHPYRDMVEKGK